MFMFNYHYSSDNPAIVIALTVQSQRKICLFNKGRPSKTFFKNPIDN